MTTPPPLTKEQLEQLYAQVLSLVPVLAAATGRPSPLISRQERREERRGPVRDDWTAPRHDQG